MQRGYEIGGLFRGLATSLLPLKTALGAAGMPISKSEKRATTPGKKMVLNAISNSTRTTLTLKRHNRRRPSHAQRIRSSDVFGTL